MFCSVIFDLDGTLLNTLDDLAAAGNYSLSVLGFPLHATDNYKQMVGNGVIKLISRMLPERARTPAIEALAFSLFDKFYKCHMMDYTAPYPGIMELLDSLRAYNIPLAVASNKSHEYVGPIVERYFPGYFSFVHGKREGVPSKPDPSLVMEILNAPAMQTPLYCGDSHVDMLTAHNAGLLACGVLWGFREREELAVAADFLLETPAELQKLILGGNLS